MAWISRPPWSGFNYHIIFFLLVALVGTWTPHLHISISLPLKNTFSCQYSSAPVSVVFLTLGIPLLCKPHPFFMSHFKSYFFWPFQVQMTFWILLLWHCDFQGKLKDLELGYLGSNLTLEMWFFFFFCFLWTISLSLRRQIIS